jgi:SAM-dependent methyltransferase
LARSFDAEASRCGLYKKSGKAMTAAIAIARRKSFLPKARKRLRRLFPTWNLYQAKRGSANSERWKLIAANLRGDETSLLDIGCNIGALTADAAAAGMVAIGFDVDPLAIRRAGEYHKQAEGLAFGRLSFRPEVAGKLPRVDVTLCLSVHHYWARAYGDAASWEMVRALMERTQSKFFFEPASTRSKYGEHAPPIVDLDRDSIVSHTLAALTSAGGGQFSVACIGETAALSREPFRLMFCATRR